MPVTLRGQLVAVVLLLGFLAANTLVVAWNDTPTVDDPAFLNGQWSQTGWWYYFLEALAVQTPLATIVLAGNPYALTYARDHTAAR